MKHVATLKVSKRGQMSLPASSRHRWGLDPGGEVGAIDMGSAVLLVSGGTPALRQALATGHRRRSLRTCRHGDRRS